MDSSMELALNTKHTIKVLKTFIAMLKVFAPAGKQFTVWGKALREAEGKAPGAKKTQIRAAHHEPLL
jgi:hypothetical protein